MIRLLWFTTKACIAAALSQLALRTNAGRDWQARIMGDTASNATGSYASATYFAVTANGTSPNAADTTLTGEIAGGSTLARAQGVYAHTNGTSSYTVTKTLTSDQTVTLQKVGLFTASSGGTMAFESLLNAAASMVSGDQIQLTVTVTL